MLRNGAEIWAYAEVPLRWMGHGSHSRCRLNVSDPLMTIIGWT